MNIIDRLKAIFFCHNLDEWNEWMIRGKSLAMEQYKWTKQKQPNHPMEVK